MIRTIIEHDIVAATAEIKYEHNGVTFQEKIEIPMIIPGSMHIFAELGVPFDEAMQMKIIDKHTENVRLNIEQGLIKNPPVPVEPEPIPTGPDLAPEPEVQEELEPATV